MKKITSSDLEELKKIFLFANTPMYLVNRFQNNSTVQYLSIKHDSQELIKEFMNSHTCNEEDFNCYIYMIALLFAISKKNYIEIEEFFINLESLDFFWKNEILNILFEKVMNTSVINHTSENIHIKKKYPISLDSSSESYINLNLEEKNKKESKQ